MKINLNDNVRVKLNDRGRFIWNRYWVLATHNDDHSMNSKITEDGYLQEQLWVVMNVFGPHLQMGFDQPMETNMDYIGMVMPEPAAQVNK